MSESLFPSFSSLLDALSLALGQTVSFGEDEECILEFDDEIDIVLARARGKTILSLRSALTPDGQQPDPALLQQALSLNYTSMPAGYMIALNDTDRQLLLVALVDWEVTSAQRFVMVVENFLELVPQLRKQCAGVDNTDHSRDLVASRGLV